MRAAHERQVSSCRVCGGLSARVLVLRTAFLVVVTPTVSELTVLMMWCSNAVWTGGLGGANWWHTCTMALPTMLSR